MRSASHPVRPVFCAERVMPGRHLNGGFPPEVGFASTSGSLDIYLPGGPANVFITRLVPDLLQTQGVLSLMSALVTVQPAAGLDATAAQIRACTKCRLHRGRTFAVPGEGPVGARLFLVGEGPGRQEDEAGRPFVGASGRLLTQFLGEAGTSRDHVFITNVVKCRPPNNRTPRVDEIDACHPYLAAQLAAVGPRAIVTMGATALRSLLGPNVDLHSARRRRRRYAGIPVFATYHPAAVLRNRRLARVVARDLTRAARFAGAATRIRSEPPVPGLPSRPERSAGCVVVGAEGKVVLLRRADEEVWCLPKGHIESGESTEQAALREVFEETGLKAKILRILPEIRYSFHRQAEPENIDKTVRYFLAEVVGGRVRPEASFAEARWCDRPQSLRLLHYENDRRVVRAAFGALTRRRP